jgi:hypothetical protein
MCIGLDDNLKQKKAIFCKHKHFERDKSVTMKIVRIKRLYQFSLKYVKRYFEDFLCL